VVFTFPSSAVRKLEDPGGVLTLRDQVLAAQASFVSSPPRKRPERVVADTQISAGYMHAGYPIMIPTDDSVPLGLSDERLRKEGAWGYFHEFGHNHQNGAWTFEGTGEVTNNVIVLYVYEKVLGQRFDSGSENIRDRAQRNRRIREYMAKGAPFEEWKQDAFLALMMYIQVYEAFGPEPFKSVFAEYARLPEEARPKSDDDKRDQWLVRLSRHTGKNLGPFFKAWGVPTSEGARAAVAGLPGWMPVLSEGPAGVPAVNQPRPGSYTIRSVKSGKHLSPRGGSREAGTDLIQDGSRPTPVVWRAEKVADAFRIINTVNNLALEAAGDAVKLQPRRQDAAAGQLWQFVKVGDAYHIASKLDGRVLDVEGNSGDDGARVILYGRKEQQAENQLWKLTEVRK
jgi:hypothetical protein